MTPAILHFSSTSCLNLSLVFPSICFGFPFSVIPNLFFSSPQAWLSQEVTLGVVVFKERVKKNGPLPLYLTDRNPGSYFSQRAVTTETVKNHSIQSSLYRCVNGLHLYGTFLVLSTSQSTLHYRLHSLIHIKLLIP